MINSQQHQGFTLLELLVVITIIGILSGIAALGIRGLEKPALSDARAVATVIKTARSAAMSTLSTVRLSYNTGSRTFSAQANTSCAPTTGWTPLAGVPPLTLHPRVEILNMTPAPWQICFTPRGQADGTAAFNLRDPGKPPLYSVAVYLGGAVEVRQ